MSDQRMRMNGQHGVYVAFPALLLGALAALLPAAMHATAYAMSWEAYLGTAPGAAIGLVAGVAAVSAVLCGYLLWLTWTEAPHKVLVRPTASGDGGGSDALAALGQLSDQQRNTLVQALYSLLGGNRVQPVSPVPAPRPAPWATRVAGSPRADRAARGEPQVPSGPSMTYQLPLPPAQPSAESMTYHLPMPPQAVRQGPGVLFERRSQVGPAQMQPYTLQPYSQQPMAVTDFDAPLPQPPRPVRTQATEVQQAELPRRPQSPGWNRVPPAPPGAPGAPPAAPMPPTPGPEEGAGTEGVRRTSGGKQRRHSASNVMRSTAQLASPSGAREEPPTPPAAPAPPAPPPYPPVPGSPRQQARDPAIAALVEQASAPPPGSPRAPISPLSSFNEHDVQSAAAAAVAAAHPRLAASARSSVSAPASVHESPSTGAPQPRRWAGLELPSAGEITADNAWVQSAAQATEAGSPQVRYLGVLGD